MQSLLSSFHLEIDSFSKLLNATGGIVAGSAALAALVAGTPYTFTPNDLDIWVHSDSDPVYMFLFSYFFGQHGYSEVDQPMQSDTEYTSNPIFAILGCIQRFQHPSGCVVQVMHCKVCVDDVLDTFDLSVAATCWRPSSEEGCLYNQDAESIHKGIMYSLRPPMTDREKERIHKYEARGFTMMYF